MHPQRNDEFVNAESLRQELRLRFPVTEGYEVSEATWIEIRDGKQEETPVTT